MNQALKSNKQEPIKNEPHLKTRTKEQFPFKQDLQAKFKTEFCRNLEYGVCEFGEKCFFAHSISELRDKSHSGFSLSIKCKHFFEFGYCINGNKCQFSHKENIESVSNSPNASTKASSKNSEDMHKAPIFIDLEYRSRF